MNIKTSLNEFCWIFVLLRLIFNNHFQKMDFIFGLLKPMNSRNGQTKDLLSKTEKP